jgi:hypothetical protein
VIVILKVVAYGKRLTTDVKPRGVGITLRHHTRRNRRSSDLWKLKLNAELTALLSGSEGRHCLIRREIKIMDID